GNICRSPLAEGVLRQRLAERAPELPVLFDSAGTHGYHTGAPPDARAISAARRRGIDISGLQARTVEASDFEEFDLILAMDEDNHASLLERAAEEYHDKVRFFLDFVPGGTLRNVPDPYYGGPVGFERVLDLVEMTVDGLVQEL